MSSLNLDRMDPETTSIAYREAIKNFVESQIRNLQFALDKSSEDPLFSEVAKILQESVDYFGKTPEEYMENMEKDSKKTQDMFRRTVAQLDDLRKKFDFQASTVVPAANMKKQADTQFTKAQKNN